MLLIVVCWQWYVWIGGGWGGGWRGVDAVEPEEGMWGLYIIIIPLAMDSEGSCHHDQQY